MALRQGYSDTNRINRLEERCGRLESLVDQLAVRVLALEPVPARPRPGPALFTAVRPSRQQQQPTGCAEPKDAELTLATGERRWRGVQWTRLGVEDDWRGSNGEWVGIE
ncbi:hypothetical protein FJT64_011800 [Amphibalanus amphitrite]|uniref:Uncharacterized protein n=1 Tax=Amphibalanus amphitrite TaxID=1232801 RepID=A0A6A4VHZ7_AMPAM|nr:hypothetical protein FJT64_011800 [Amphibalanus amphitrite]